MDNGKKPGHSYHFTEILFPEEQEDDPTSSYVEAYIVSVDAQRCGSLVKQVARDFPIGKDLAHLKRVRRRQQQHLDERSQDVQSLPSVPNDNNCHGQEVSDTSSHTNKRRKKSRDTLFSDSPNVPLFLDVLIGSCSEVDRILLHNKKSPNSDDDNFVREKVCPQLEVASSGLESTHEMILAKILNVGRVYREEVPAQSPKSRTRWEEYHAIWPTNFFPMKTIEHKTRQLELSDQDIQQMTRGMNAALQDCQIESNGRIHAPGAVVILPHDMMTTHTEDEDAASQGPTAILSMSSEERVRQGQEMIGRNPLATSILLAIQGVSRTEREVVLGQQMATGRYLCTGCDLYTTQEPSVFDAMALVHSRIRRVIFLDESDAYNICHKEPTIQSYTKGLTEKFVHRLPGTNHKFRAFRCRPFKAKMI